MQAKLLTYLGPDEMEKAVRGNKSNRHATNVDMTDANGAFDSDGMIIDCTLLLQRRVASAIHSSQAAAAAEQGPRVLFLTSDTAAAARAHRVSHGHLPSLVLKDVCSRVRGPASQPSFAWTWESFARHVPKEWLEQGAKQTDREAASSGAHSTGAGSGEALESVYDLLTDAGGEVQALSQLLLRCTALIGELKPAADDADSPNFGELLKSVPVAVEQARRKADRWAAVVTAQQGMVPLMRGVSAEGEHDSQPERSPTEPPAKGPTTAERKVESEREHTGQNAAQGGTPGTGGTRALHMRRGELDGGAAPAGSMRGARQPPRSANPTLSATAAPWVPQHSAAVAPNWPAASFVVVPQPAWGWAPTIPGPAGHPGHM